MEFLHIVAGNHRYLSIPILGKQQHPLQSIKGVHHLFQHIIVGNLSILILRRYHNGLAPDLDLHVPHLVEHVTLLVRIYLWK